MKDGAFRLNMHPAAYFEGNPFGADRPLPPAKTTRKPKEKLKPFKPSNPGKAVSVFVVVVIIVIVASFM